MIDALCRSPVPYAFDGKTYEISPLTEGDFADFVSAVRWRTLHELLQVPNCPQEIINEEYRAAPKKILGMSSPEIYEQIEAQWAVVEMVYLGLRGRHPDITREAISKWDSYTTHRMQEILLIISQPWCSLDDENKKKAQALRTCKTAEEVETWMVQEANARIAKKSELKSSPAK